MTQAIHLLTQQINQMNQNMTQNNQTLTQSINQVNQIVNQNHVHITQQISDLKAHYDLCRPGFLNLRLV